MALLQHRGTVLNQSFVSRFAASRVREGVREATGRIERLNFARGNLAARRH